MVLLWFWMVTEGFFSFVCFLNGFAMDGLLSCWYKDRAERMRSVSSSDRNETIEKTKKTQTTESPYPKP